MVKPKIACLVTLAVGFLILGMIPGCGSRPAGSMADTLFINAHILTMDDTLPEVEAMAVGEGIILSIGKEAELRRVHPQAQVVDMGGRTVMPGIIESHGHLLSLGQSFLELNIEGIRRPADAVAKVEEKIAETQPGEWVIGWGWDDGAWAQAYPDNRELSRVSPENPVFLRGLHGFAGWANEKALTLAGITVDTPSPTNGEIIKDTDSGRPTGILTNEAQDLLTRHIPPLSAHQVETALQLAIRECSRFGLTSLHEARTTQAMLDAFHALKSRGELDARIYVMLDWTEEPLLERFYAQGPEIDPEHLLTVRCIKIFVDGALGSRGAAMLEPYSDVSSESGLVVTPRERLEVLTTRALRTGFQVAVHAIGDRANRLTLDAFVRSLEAVPQASDHRLRLEHAQVVALEDIPRFAPLNIMLSMQPPHCTSDMPWVQDRVGPDRVRGAYAWRSFLDTGVRLTLNSDFPGESLDPFFGMYTAMTRMTPEGEPPGGWFPEQCLTRDEVIKAYTVEAAYSEFAEDLKGRLLPGMLADFIVLSADILHIPVRDFLTLRVEETYVGGRAVYTRGPGTAPQD